MSIKAIIFIGVTTIFVNSAQSQPYNTVVLNFKTQGQESLEKLNLKERIPNELEAILYGYERVFSIVEREQLGKLLEEVQYQYKRRNIFDESTIVVLQRKGANTGLIGEIDQSEKEIKVDVKLVDIGSSSVISRGSAILSTSCMELHSEFAKQMEPLGKCLGQQLANGQDCRLTEVVSCEEEPKEPEKEEKESEKEQEPELSSITTKHWIFPGSKQLDDGRKLEGNLLRAGSFVAIGAAGSAVLSRIYKNDTDSAEETFWNTQLTSESEPPGFITRNEEYNDWQNAYNKTKTVKFIMITTAVVSAIVWAVNARDVTNSKKQNPSSTSLAHQEERNIRLAPVFSGSFQDPSYGLELTLGL